MKRNNYIAYALWFLGSFSWIAAMPIGGGLHRIYCGKFISGFAQIALFWLGSFTLWFLVGFLFWAIWGIWILLDIFFVGIWVEDLNAFASETEEDDYEQRLKKVDALYELYQKGAISKEEFEARKEILMRD
nr:NINE protein [uncultured Campylobacter sp.]